MANNNANICLFVEQVEDLKRTFESITQNDKFSGIVTHLVHPNFIKGSILNPSRITRCPLVLSTEVWTQKVIIKLTQHDIDCDSLEPHFQKYSEKILKSELSLIDHLLASSGITMVKLEMKNTNNFCKLLSDNLKGYILVEVPLTDSQQNTLNYRTDLSETQKAKRLKDPWHHWNIFRNSCDSSKLRVALEISEDIPSNKLLISRWNGEPVDYLIIPTKIFVNNQSNYPVLTKAHQELIKQFIQINKCGFILKPLNQNDRRMNVYSEYINYMNKTFYLHDMMLGYEEYLEVPLQPLYDNLDFYTYEIFEKDPVKYHLYQQAIEAALIDKVPEDKIQSVKLVLMVVGAGRGPLVRAAINASKNTKRKLKIYAVEKNPNAIPTLTSLIEELWKDEDVTLISTDMRDFHMEEKVDILVSELLGSFGDNELSPECLDGAQSHLKEDGLSIPCRSSSYIRPVMSYKLYNAIKNLEKTTTNYQNDVQYANVKAFEYCYVVYMKNFFNIDSPQELFRFVHPNNSAIKDNTRFDTLTFKSQIDCILHGFAGYFEAQLYKDIIISILPSTYTEGMTSWFSMFFPIEEPQFVKAGEKIKIKFWRKIKPFKVWYEWQNISPKISKIHNEKGQSHPIYK